MEFIKYEVWEDYWCFKPLNPISLSALEKLDFSSWKKREELEIKIESKGESNEPNNQQVETLKFITKNQPEIVASIFDYYKKVILPVYISATDIEEEEIANDASELSLVFGLLGVEIPALENHDSFYFLLQFDFKYDSEHGLYILFENSRAIDFFAEGDKDYDAISFNQKDFKIEREDPIRINLYELNGKTIFQKNYHLDEIIKFKLKKGTYRAFISLNFGETCRNFYVPKDLEEFTIRNVLTSKW